MYNENLRNLYFLKQTYARNLLLVSPLFTASCACRSCEQIELQQGRRSSFEPIGRSIGHVEFKTSQEILPGRRTYRIDGFV